MKLPPGSPLTRAELQARFNTSSTPIRDALLLLQEYNLVEIYPQHTTLVSRIDIPEAKCSQFLRRAAEIEVVRTLAGNPEKVDINRLRSLVEHQHAIVDIRQLDKFAELDFEFHQALFGYADVSDLWTLICRRGGHMDRIKQLNLPLEGKAGQILGEHQKIIDAIEAGDGVAGEAAVRMHLYRSLESAPAMAEAYPDYFTSRR